MGIWPGSKVLPLCKSDREVGFSILGRCSAAERVQIVVTIVWNSRDTLPIKPAQETT